MAASQKLVGESMLRMNQFSEFEKVDLNYTQKSGNANTEGIEFDMSAVLPTMNPDFEGGS
jgi:hypothetical protein